jgi:hypothetical protein
VHYIPLDAESAGHIVTILNDIGKEIGSNMRMHLLDHAPSAFRMGMLRIIRHLLNAPKP